uniref:Uncharacterized protein n=1 Tax=Picea glauca TaxID=3330 RepID=A0A101M266_PICGL|nr:hypothetical protein ABT39_MTgene2902 [Picea glauca]
MLLKLIKLVQLMPRELRLGIMLLKLVLPVLMRMLFILLQ